MVFQLKSLSFDQWIAHVFDHEVRVPEWYFDPGAAVWSAPASLTLQHMTNLFSDPLRYVSQYTDEQLNQGLWYLVSNAASIHMLALSDEAASSSERAACMTSFLPLFEKLYALRCTDHLSHLIKPETSGDENPLNGSCYMWWDFVSTIVCHNSDLDPIALQVMESILSLDSIACKESALHGLGHWQSSFPKQVSEIIDRALKTSKDWSRELVLYAGSAREGCVQ